MLRRRFTKHLALTVPYSPSLSSLFLWYTRACPKIIWTRETVMPRLTRHHRRVRAIPPFLFLFRLSALQFVPFLPNAGAQTVDLYAAIWITKKSRRRGYRGRNTCVSCDEPEESSLPRSKSNNFLFWRILRRATRKFRWRNWTRHEGRRRTGRGAADAINVEEKRGKRAE